jgi:ribonuclease P protein component
MKVEKQEKDETMPPVQILVSVPKKRFRHAVDRNRMKRLVRESYRLNKHILWDVLEGKNERVMLAFVCITDTLPSFRTVNKSVVKVLNRIVERMEGLPA